MISLGPSPEVLRTISRPKWANKTIKTMKTAYGATAGLIRRFSAIRYYLLAKKNKSAQNAN
ncbi:hypothetical protein, partial [uncultured Acidaminococcus sp.]|uniref:hypothetical protein n=1 Tax=uncultured Acidaminococcus sp. TaxID=352152 RepID=UPI00258ED380